MALNSNVQWNVRSDGVDTNGGGWNSGSGGDDLTNQASPKASVTDGVTNGTATITSATAGFESSDVGNVMYVQGGTGSITAGWYEIVTFNSSTSVDVDRSTGLTAGTGVTLKLGGALATPGKAAELMTVSSQKTYVKDGIYTLTTSTPGSGGPVLFNSSADLLLMEGYSSTKGDKGATPTLDAGAQTGITLFSLAGTGTQRIVSMKADGQDGASTIGFAFNNSKSSAYKCVAVDCPTGFSSTAARARTVQCFADSCATNGFEQCAASRCRARQCGNGFNIVTQNTLMGCVADGCTTDGFVFATNSGSTIRDCTSDGNGQYGFNFGSGLAIVAENLLATNNTSAGYFASGTANSRLVKCADYNNSTRKSGSFFADDESITCTADPYVDRAGGDFRLNSTSGGGGLLQGAGVQVYGQSDASDVGAVKGGTGAGAAGARGSMRGGFIN